MLKPLTMQKSTQMARILQELVGQINLVVFSLADGTWASCGVTTDEICSSIRTSTELAIYTIENL